MNKKISRALISVADKTHILEFCQALQQLGIELLASGGTAKLLAQHNITSTEISDYTHFPEIMDNRVKTLHPKVHGGILGRRGIDDEVMASHGIQAIDLVVVNLYPFEQVITETTCDLATAIANIDIGGPALIRAAAKNYNDVTVVVDPDDYTMIINTLQNNATHICQSTRFKLALQGFAYTARYDTAIAAYLGTVHKVPFPPTLNLQFQHTQSIRYGENPHQNAAFYTEKNPATGTIAVATQIQGKQLSYNNIADADAALECVKSFADSPACVIVKHANPCGVAQAKDILIAYDLAYATDPTSAFGGIIAFNQTLDITTAATIIKRQFVEVIIAPNISPEAKTLLAEKKNIRVLECGAWHHKNTATFDFKRVACGLLVQDKDLAQITLQDLTVVSQRQPNGQQMEDMLFAWKVAKFVKSNAIVYCQNRQTIGIGAGQMSRIYSAKIATIKATDAHLTVAGSVMASDAFFPFRDGVDVAAQAGITAIIQPGGSVRDEEIIAATNEHGIAMVFTGMRHFRH